MPRTRSLAWAELKIGMVTIFALTMTAILIFAVGGTSGFFWQNYPLKVVFMNVAGIKAGSPVRVAGVEVGSVEHVQFSGAGVEVWFTVADDMRPLVTDRSVASIGSISLLGEGAVDITAAPAGTPLRDWQYVRAGIAEGSIAQLTGEASDSIAAARTLVEDLRKGKGTIGRLFTDDSLYREFDGFMRAAERVTRSVADGKGSLGKLAQDPSFYSELQKSVANLNAITARIRAGEGSLGQLMTDPAFAKSLSSTTENLNTLTGRLSRGEGTAGKLLTDDQLYTRMDDMTARLDTLVQRLNEGQGTAGQLLQDRQLYENMNQAVAEVRSLIADIRKDPRKYLNVKVSIF
jgi:phospholipid/cholesterol/gamma-HCH transport system substrate-binding protein